jgi:methionyl-tRNA formyltransferase
MWIGGNHARHLYYANCIEKSFALVGAVIEQREAVLPTPPERISQRDKKNFIRHFAERQQAEEKYFSKVSQPQCPVKIVTEESLNSIETRKFIEEIKPDVVLIFGCGLIKDPVVSVLPYHTINMHLGLSPWYRGSATLFWPFYFLEPNFAGSTFHYITSEPDAGDIVHQVVPELNYGDGIHDVGCRTVLQSAKEAVLILKKLESTGEITRHKQRSSGKNFLTRDFRPEHLRVIYDLFNNRLVDAYLDNEVKTRKPKLIRQFAIESVLEG